MHGVKVGAIVAIDVRGCLTTLARRIAGKRDPAQAALASVERLHMARHAVWYPLRRDRTCSD
jgi:hypothetical protein